MICRLYSRLGGVVALFLCSARCYTAVTEREGEGEREGGREREGEDMEEGERERQREGVRVTTS